MKVNIYKKEKPIMAIKKFSDMKKMGFRKLNEQEIQLQPQTSQPFQQNQPQIQQPQVQTTVQVQQQPQPVQQVDQNQPQQPQQQEQKASVTVVNFFSKLFESREMAHMYHLQTKGNGAYAQHMALGSFYEDVIGLIDDLVETYQGQYEIVEGYDVIDSSANSSKDKIAYFQELATFIKNERKIISQEDTHLHNIIDEIVALTYKTLYKLRFLN